MLCIIKSCIIEPGILVVPLVRNHEAQTDISRPREKE
ncbi:predicted protein [Plenodomus lingam JN3]|uniref:Predicted protein n=1 Tax=Leptosphaeria maculans (strain JN3 / isolate v23.1.3 / race Av1-4-5-6-7-8) TaxID=985895 RepID=E5AEB0_LEPMJ|nr:predicted protein [Plenodomus lingam JN3]CBY01549.1 predicted protein [Plenodomus lingam JN3]